MFQVALVLEPVGTIAEVPLHMAAAAAARSDGVGSASPLEASLDCDGSRCHSECELRHLDEFERAARETPCAKPSRLVICAGPERSGSTWLYNAVRHLYSACESACDSYWIHCLDASKIERRLNEDRTVLVKTHEYNSDYDRWLFSQYNPIVVTTHRDLREVLVSYMRVGWARDIPREYVDQHMKWLKHASMDIGFEQILAEPEQVLRSLAGLLQLDESKAALAKHRVDALKPASDRVDQVTKMWPSHKSGGQRRSKQEFNDLVARFSEFYDHYPELLSDA